MSLSTMLKRLLPRKIKKDRIMAASERLAVELARVKMIDGDWAGMSDEERTTMSYTVAEKEAMYRARGYLRFLPPTGANGGLVQAIATEIDRSRQYVHQTFYPKDPVRLFAGRSAAQKDAWKSLVRRTDDHRTLPKYRAVFERLLAGHVVRVTIAVSKFKFIRRKAMELVPGTVIAEDRSTVPTTYTLTPPG